HLARAPRAFEPSFEVIPRFLPAAAAKQSLNEAVIDVGEREVDVVSLEDLRRAKEQRQRLVVPSQPDQGPRHAAQALADRDRPAQLLAELELPLRCLEQSLQLSPVVVEL